MPPNKYHILFETICIKLFDCNQSDPIDDNNFIPLVNAVIEGIVSFAVNRNINTVNLKEELLNIFEKLYIKQWLQYAREDEPFINESQEIEAAKERFAELHNEL